MEDGSLRLNREAGLRALAAQVRDFAIDEAKSSGLSGQDQGPADAYRHLVGVAELSRRAGPLLAAGMAEAGHLRIRFGVEARVVLPQFFNPPIALFGRRLIGAVALQRILALRRAKLDGELGADPEHPLRRRPKGGGHEAAVDPPMAAGQVEAGMVGIAPQGLYSAL